MLAKENERNKIFVEEYQKKVNDDKARATESVKKTEEGKIAENKLKTRKRKRENLDTSAQQTNMWKKLKGVKRQHKDAVEQALRKSGWHCFCHTKSNSSKIFFQTRGWFWWL